MNLQQILANQVQKSMFPKFDEALFRKMLPNLTDSMINDVVQQAKMMGISDAQIQEGLQMLKNLQ